MPDLDQRLAALCRELERGDLHAIATEISAMPLLDRILAALAGGAGDRASAALASDLDELDARLIDYGILGGLLPPDWRLYEQNPAAAQPAPAVEVWGCPGGRCTRWLPADDLTGQPPQCPAQGEPMTKRQLPR